MNRVTHPNVEQVPWEPVPEFTPPQPTVAQALEQVWTQCDSQVAELGVACRSCGQCCDFRRADHILFAAKIELDVCLAWAREHVRLPRREVEAALSDGLCPFWRREPAAGGTARESAGLCGVRPVRPLGCRVYYCSGSQVGALERLSRELHHELVEVSRRGDAGWWYGPALVYIRSNVQAWGFVE
jgi:Fe-S-cluster containining protein